MTYGPVDFIALEFETHKLRGEILPALLDLVEKKIIRVIDLIIIRKQADGSVDTLELQQLDADLISVFDPLQVEVTGIIQVEDIDAIADAMASDSTAAVLLIENLWAVAFKEAVLRAGGQLISQERIPLEAVEEMLEIFAAAEA